MLFVIRLLNLNQILKFGVLNRFSSNLFFEVSVDLNILLVVLSF